MNNNGMPRYARLMSLMGIEAIYPKRNLCKLVKANCIQPYLLRGLAINRSNQVWQIDVSYVSMDKGFMYLTKETTRNQKYKTRKII